MIFFDNTKSLQELYDEVPVDLDVFIEDDRYLGRHTMNGKRIYPFWRNALRDMFNQDKTIFMNTAIGVGRTFATNIAMAYYLYNLMCLHDPQEHFHLLSEDPISIAFMNSTLQNAERMNDVFVSMLCESPWFLEHGKVQEKEVFRGPTVRHYFKYTIDKNIDIIFGCKVGHFLGKQVLCANVSTDNLESYKRIDYESIQGIKCRILSRAIKDGKNQGLMIWEHRTTPWYSVPAEKMDLFEISGAQWDIKPREMFTWDKQLKVIVNPAVKKSRLMKPGEIYGKEEYTISIPDQFEQSFILDADTALMNLTGIQLSVLEHHVPFAEAYKKLMSGDYFIEYYDTSCSPAIPCGHQCYYVDRGIIYDRSYGTPTKAELWDARLLEKFLNWNDWTVGPVEYYDL